MLSSKLSVSMLSTLLRRHGIRDVVLSPGSRNVPLIHNFTADPYFECTLVSDERSAAFFALGIALRTGKPCAVCCTSGSALLNMHSAVSEAYYQKVPLLVISADRSKAYISQKDGQTLEQDGVFGYLAKRSVELPQVRDDDDTETYWFCSRLINEALAEVRAAPRGPVHINVPISDPLFEYGGREPQTGFFERTGLTEAVDFTLKFKKRLLVIGQRSERLAPDRDTLRRLEENFLVFSEHLSNVRGLKLGSALDLALAGKGDHRELAPEVVVSMGGHVISKRLKQYLRSLDCPHVSFDDGYADTFMNMRYLVKGCPDEEVLCVLAAMDSPCDRAYLKAVRDKCSGLTDRKFPYSHMQVIKRVFSLLRDGDHLHLGNSSSVRHAELFSTAADVQVMCNRGVNGIDGSLSTAMGYANDSAGMNYAVLGDLSFFYDANALWQPQVPKNIKIVLINNRGGGVFPTIKGFKVEGHARHFVLADHEHSAEHLCRGAGLGYFEARDQESLDKAFEAFASHGGPCLLECFTSIEKDMEALRDFLSTIDR